MSSPPRRLYQWNRRVKKARDGATSVFQPYPEQLPLEAGGYAFVLDNRGRFRVVRGLVSSHAAMVLQEPVAAAGFFWITRVGKVGNIQCRSVDYPLWADGPTHPLVRFVIDAFQKHQAFDVSPHAIFEFSRTKLERFDVGPDGVPVLDAAEFNKRLEAEGQGTDGGGPFPDDRTVAFARYVPTLPPRLYAMKQDQLAEALDLDDRETFEVGDFKAAYGPADGRLSSGRKAFVVDPNGRLIVGHGHHLLSGGRPVGAAGQIYVDEEGVVTTINLNFSGHYRPPLTAEYARYTYTALIGHPLLSFTADCAINGRRNFSLEGPLTLIAVDPHDLLMDDGRLEYLLDADDVWADDEEATEE
ncbi:hypothetical protein [Paludisphaera sp.]|uniref:hypothetical protein n=1 Tax=Paludisphaera sp. TaxID=2017432 RepID=UPI00301DF949